MMGNGGGVALTFLFAALLIGGLVLLVLVGVQAVLGGVSRPSGPAASTEEHDDHADDPSEET